METKTRTLKYATLGLVAATVFLHTEGNAATLTFTTSSALTTPQGNNGSEMEYLADWKAGRTVSQASIKEYGLEKCFSSVPIPDHVFTMMKGKSFKTGCTVSRESLRYVKVLHWDGNGKVKLGEIVCHRSIADDLVDIFRKLYAARYPIERMVLIDNYGADDNLSMAANNTSCFNFRHVAGTKVTSNHSYGKAIDINPLYNPFVKSRNGKTSVSPKEGKTYADRTRNFKYKIDKDDLCYREFKKHGFTWGGSWKHSKDYQHFEKK